MTGGAHTSLTLSEVSQHPEHKGVVRGAGLNPDYRKSADEIWRDYAAAERRADRSRERGDRAGELIAAGQAARCFAEWLAAPL